MRTLNSATGLLVIGCSALLIASCGGSKSSSLSPVAPTGVASTPSAGGSSIIGQVNGGSSLASAGLTGAMATGVATAFSTAATTTSGVTVSVMGRNQSTGVDPLGRFEFSGLPEGTYQLQFTGPGVSGTITVTVGANDRVTIAVTVNGSSVTLESHARASADSKAELEGQITEINATARTLRVSGALVNVPASADIRRGSAAVALSSLAVGDRIHVKGTRQGDVVQATEITVQNQNQNPPVELSGVVAGLTGGCPMLTFSVRSSTTSTTGTTVATDGSTFFKEGRCSDLQNGDRVELKGQRRADSSILASQVKSEDSEDSRDDDSTRNTVGIEGLIAGFTACPTPTFRVGTVTVFTNASTKFEGGTCTSLSNGVSVEVQGVRQTDGRLLAQTIEVKPLEVKGTVAGKTGTCPAITFRVNATTTVVTTATTRFKDVACTGVVDGRKVQVNGSLQADGRILATSVELDD